MRGGGRVVPSGDFSSRMTNCATLPKTFQVLALKTLDLGTPLSPLGKLGWFDALVIPFLSPLHHFHEARLLRLKGCASVVSGTTDENINMLIIQNTITLDPDGNPAKYDNIWIST